MVMIRYLPDGTLHLPRPDPDQERVLDAHFNRAPGELRWHPIPKGNVVGFEELRGTLGGRRAVIIGKGPSLDRALEIELEAADCLITINEAAAAPLPTTPTYCVALDADVAARMRGRWPTGATVLLLPALAIGEAGAKPIGRGFFDNGLAVTDGTAATAIRLAALGGASRLLMVGFDAYDAPAAPEAIYAACIAGIAAPRVSPDFTDLNKAIASEIKRGKFQSVEWWHRTIGGGKQKTPKGKG